MATFQSFNMNMICACHEGCLSYSQQYEAWPLFPAAPCSQPQSCRHSTSRAEISAGTCTVADLFKTQAAPRRQTAPEKLSAMPAATARMRQGVSLQRPLALRLSMILRPSAVDILGRQRKTNAATCQLVRKWQRPYSSRLTHALNVVTLDCSCGLSHTVSK
jgi:hypothetical protein